MHRRDQGLIPQPMINVMTTCFEGAMACIAEIKG